jgi:hypothetical protein
MLASDMYSLGVVFLFMKYLVPEFKRNSETVKLKLEPLLSDQALSSIIISQLLNAFPTHTVVDGYSNLC